MEHSEQQCSSCSIAAPHIWHWLLIYTLLFP